MPISKGGTFLRDHPVRLTDPLLLPLGPGRWRVGRGRGSGRHLPRPHWPLCEDAGARLLQQLSPQLVYVSRSRLEMWQEPPTFGLAFLSPWWESPAPSDPSSSPLFARCQETQKPREAGNRPRPPGVMGARRSCRGGRGLELDQAGSSLSCWPHSWGLLDGKWASPCPLSAHHTGAAGDLPKCWTEDCPRKEG